MRFPAIALLLIVLALSLAACRDKSGGTTASGGASGNADSGKALFASKGCITCHTLSAVPGANGTIGPNLNGIASKAGKPPEQAGAKPPETPEQYLDESIRDPGAF